MPSSRMPEKSPRKMARATRIIIGRKLGSHDPVREGRLQQEQEGDVDEEEGAEEKQVPRDGKTLHDKVPGEDGGRPSPGR